MSYVTADPELMTLAASDLAGIGSNVSAAHMVAAAQTVTVIPAAADEVSAGIAHLFSQHAQDYQALAGQASAFHDQFVQHLTAGAASYATAEAANVTSLTGQIYGFFNPNGWLTFILSILTDMLDSGASFVQFAMTHSLFDDLAAPFLFVGLTLALALPASGQPYLS